MNQPTLGKKLFIRLFLHLSTLLLIVTSYAQDSIGGFPLYDGFRDYTYAARELAFGHLNKSVFIDGETLGFSIYVFDKGTKTFATKTKNMYCTISDPQGKVIKSKLIFMFNGVGNGSFFIDESLTAGNYTFKAYTNYMKNFEEQNYYIQNFRVVEDVPDETTLDNESRIDAQFLPEGGHLLENVHNNIGVTIKDGFGQGMGNIRGKIVDSQDKPITEFTTDPMGFAKFNLRPLPQTTYKAVINHENEEVEFDIEAAEKLGINMVLSDLNNRIALQFKTNKATYSSIKDKRFTLTFHNGKDLKSIDLEIGERMEVTKFINRKDLYSGINVFTLFNEDNRPLLERLYFNYEGIKLHKTTQAVAKKVEDSIEVRLNIKRPDSLDLHNFSISVLPTETESYLHSHNIISYLYLQPYVRGYIENAIDYFTDINITKQRQLDMLLITQGWSAYNWNNLFNIKPKYIHKFEQGISVTTTLGEESYQQYSMTDTNWDVNVIDVEEGVKNFTLRNKFPFDGTRINVSGIAGNGNLNRAPVYVQFAPSKIPDFDKYIKMLPRRKPTIFKDLSFQELLQTSWSGIEQLDEIVLNVNRKKEAMEKIRSTADGQVDEFDAQSRYSFRNFATYLRSRGFQVFDREGQFIISNSGRVAARSVPPVIYLNGIRLSDPTIVAQLDMSIVDYTIINKNSSPGSPGGSIRVFTDPTATSKTSYYSPYVTFDYPLTFAEPKRFYAPRYTFYRSSFFKKYGVVDWIPRGRLDEKGDLVFRFADMGYGELSLFIEGSADGSFISEKVDLVME